MFLSLLSNKYVLGFIGIAALVLVLYGIFTYQSKKIETLTGKLGDLTLELQAKDLQVQGLESSISSIESSIESTSELTSVLSEKQEAINKDINAKLKIFEGERLESLAAKKPGLMEKRVNNATIKVFDQIELETQAFREENQ